MKQTLIALFLLVAIADRGQTSPVRRYIRAIFLCSDSVVQSVPWIAKGYILQELHNTAEGVNDAGAVRCIDEQGNEISCYSDYWKDIKNLDSDKKPFKPQIIIWQTLPGK